MDCLRMPAFPAPGPCKHKGMALLLALPALLGGCIGPGGGDEARILALEREVEALSAELDAMRAAHRHFANESGGEAEALVELVAAVGELQQEHSRIELNHSEVQRRAEVIDHFLKELRPASPADPQEVAMAQRVAEDARASVVKIRVKLEGGTSSGGTGWAWAPDLVVTASHVVARSGARVTVATLDGRTFDAALLNTSGGQDTALLRVPGLDLRALTVGASSPVQGGQPVVAIGHPQGYAPWSVSLGHVTGTTGGAQPRVQSNAPIGSGSSGGPILDAEGRVVGMTIGGLWPAGSEATPAGTPLHVHVAPLTTAAETATHVPIDTVASLVQAWTSQDG